ncbi:MAG: hypothetical protein ACRES2_01130 [Steroidobacteraceae bacterium]
MTDPADAPAYRHPQVYHTMRGLALSGGRGAADPASAVAQASATAAGSESLRVQSQIEHEPAHDDSAGLYELRRYSEPND